MKKILLKKRINLAKHTKTFSIQSRTEDKACKTLVKKSFTYVVDRAKSAETEPRKPLVFIKKTFDTKQGIEGFSFHVKGYFFATHKRELIKVWFHHMLDIEIRWKTKNYSPKESESLI